MSEERKMKTAKKTAARKNRMPASPFIEEGWMELVSNDGRKFKVPGDFAMILADLVGRVSSLEKALQEQHRPASADGAVPRQSFSEAPCQASDDGEYMLSHIRNQESEVFKEEQAAAPVESLGEQSGSSSHVEAQETPTCYCDNIHSEMETSSSSLPLSAYQQDAGSAWGEGRDKTRPESDLDTCGKHPEDSSEHSKPECSRPKQLSSNVRSIVEKWPSALRFSGEGFPRIEIFLAGVKISRTNANLTDDEMLSIIDELLTEKAASWFKTQRDRWQCWADFEKAARDQFGVAARVRRRYLGARSQVLKDPPSELSSAKDEETDRKSEETTSVCSCQVMPVTDDSEASRQGHLSSLQKNPSGEKNSRPRRRKRRRRKRKKSLATVESPNDTSSSDESGKKLRTDRDLARRSRLKFDPTQPLKCYGCGRLGFMQKYCPDCNESPRA